MAQFMVLVLPGTIAGTWYDCDVETHEAYGTEYDSYQEAFDALIASGFEAADIAPEGYLGLVAID